MARFYDPKVPHFLTQDPVIEGQEDQSLYQYGWNNPILQSDPNGDCPLCPVIPFFPEIGAVLVAAGEAIGSTVVGTAIGVLVNKAIESGASGLPSVGPEVYTKRFSEAQNAVNESKSANISSSTNSQKATPNPDGKKGGKAHQETNKKEADRMESEGKKVKSETAVSTPDGKKSRRFVDQTGTDPKTSEKEMVQIGKQNKNGTPVKRERDAMDDIEKATGQRPKFVPYNN